MKRLNMAAYTAILIFLVFSLVTYTACKDSPCKDVLCRNGSICTDGNCICPTGYSGTHCEIKDPCLDMPCFNGGVCNNGKCECPPGYGGAHCEGKIDPCKNVVCQNGGTCVDGKCQCPEGYEGVNCEKEIRAKVIRIWNAADVTSGGGTIQYNPQIKPGNTLQDLLISKFSNSFFTNDVKATFWHDIITIPAQTPDAGGSSVSGTGAYNNTTKEIIWTYTLTNQSGASSSYTGTWRQ